MTCKVCQFTNDASARHCARCGTSLASAPRGESLAETIVPATRAIGGAGAAAAPALALSDSNLGATIIGPPPSASSASPGSSASSSTPDTDATFIGHAPSSHPPLAGTSMAASANPADSPTMMGVTMGAARPAQSPEPGRLPDFGARYQVLSILGQGGMGAVYKARDLELDRIVALKQLRAELVPDAGAIQRFKQELLLASKVSHRNILRIHDLGDANGMKYISMAYIEGQDLHHLLQKEGRLPVERALKFARQTLDALDAAHAEGVVHRDLKPQNIMVDANDQIYVMDFGLAKSVETDVHMTMTGQVVGTPQYMAPEQVEGSPVDARTDLYAFGLILDEMLTGDLVFRADSAFHLMLKRVREAPRSPREILPDLPDYVERIVMRCLMREPAQRYQSAREILDDLAAQHAAEVAAQPTLVLAAPALAIAAPAKKGFAAASMMALSLAALVAVAMLVSLAIPSVRARIFGKPGGAANAAASPPAHRLAVLPLKVLGGDAAQADLADGVIDAVSAKLLASPGLFVASAGDVHALGREMDPQKAAEKLGVDYIASGTLTTGAKGEMRVALTMTDHRTGQTRSAPEIQGSSNEPLSLEDDIYKSIVKQLDLQGTNEGALHPTESTDAYKHYLQGQNLVRRGEMDPKQLRDAISEYHAALQIDPRFASALAGIADADVRLFRRTKDPAFANDALTAGQQANQLNDQLPEVRFALGSAYVENGKIPEALAELEEAVKLEPNSDEGYRRLGDAYRTAKQWEKAEGSYQQAINLNQYSWFNFNALGSLYMRTQAYAKALDQFQEATRLNPTSSEALANQGGALVMLGKYDEAVKALQQSLSVAGNASPQSVKRIYANLGTAEFFMKPPRYDDAAKAFQKAVELDPNYDLGWENLGDSDRQAGRVTDANAAYDKAIALISKRIQANPRDDASLGQIAVDYAKKGDSAKAQPFIDRALSVNPNSGDLAYKQAVIYALKRDPAAALKSLDQAFQNHYSVQNAKDDLDLRALQSSPAFAELVKKYSSAK